MADERGFEFDLANERVVIATMVHVPAERRRIPRLVSAPTFGDPRNQTIFRALTKMGRSGLEWSEDTLADIAGADDFGGFEYVRAIVEDYQPNANVDYHLDRLKLDAAKFAIRSEDLPEIAEHCEDPKATATKLASRLRAALSRVERMGRRFVSKGDELREHYWDELRTRMLVGDVVVGTGFSQLDSGLTRGFIPGLSVIAGRPGHGKSTWLANFLRNRVGQRKPTYVCGWEMMREDYLDMMVAIETGISTSDLARKLRDMPKAEKEEIVRAVKRFTDEDLIAIERNPFGDLEKPEKRWDLNERNLDYLESVIQQECDRYDVFCLDVVAKMLADRRPDAISEALVRIREMAFTYGVHIMALHHTNRDSAQGRPTLEGLKGSGAFEEEADIIFGLDRPILRASPARRAKMVDVLDVHFLKQRKGPAPLCFRYRFDGAHASLTDETEVDVAMLEDDEDEQEMA